MEDLRSLFVAAVGLSLGFAVPPGAVTAEALRRGCRRGLRPVLLFQLGALAGSASWATLGAAGWLAGGPPAPVRMLLAAAGVLAALRSGWRALGDARAAWRPAPQAAGSDFLAGAGMGLASPVAAAFWLGAGATLGLPTDDGRTTAVSVFLLGVALAGLVYRCALAALIAWGRRFLPAAGARWIDGLCGAGSVYVGLRLLVDAFRLP